MGVGFQTDSIRGILVILRRTNKEVILLNFECWAFVRRYAGKNGIHFSVGKKILGMGCSSQASKQGG